jgi:hypothetical protein
MTVVGIDEGSSIIEEGAVGIDEGSVLLRRRTRLGSMKDFPPSKKEELGSMKDPSFSEEGGGWDR